MAISDYKRKALLLLLLLLPGMLWAGNTGKLAGTVKDKDSGEALPGANVLVTAIWEGENEIALSETPGAATDLDGQYFILSLRPGLYTVKAVYVGYREYVITMVKIDVDKTTLLNFDLSSELMESEEITVTAYRPNRVEVDVTATKQVYDTRTVEAIAGVNDVNDILQLQADVVDDHFRGGRLGEATYLMGGGALVNPLDNRRAFSPIVTGLEQVEVYTSGFSAEYGNAQSGVVNMVAREGGPEWKSRMEVSATLPYYKTWQGSPYNKDNLYFYESLSQLNEWLKDNPTQPGKPLYDAGYGFGPKYLRSPLYWGWPPPGQDRLRQDSLEVAKLGQILWYEAVRDIGLEYNKKMDYRLDFSTGGPLGKNTYIFLAARQTSEQPKVPMPDPDVNRQVMINISNKSLQSDKFKLSLTINRESYSYLSDFRRYLFDRTLNAQYYENTSLQYSMEWRHLFSKATFSEVSLSLLDLVNKARLDMMNPGEFIDDYRNTNWTDYTMPSYHRVGRPYDDAGDRKTKTYTLNANLTSQVNNNNLLKGGVQFSYYDLFVDLDGNMSTAGSYRKVKFNAFPYEGGLYFQDKMEFAGMIANLGLRFDFYHLNTDYYGDLFHPLRDPSNKFRTKLYTNLQPRIGISFPVSESSVFHLNYGSFTQRPNFNQLFFNQITNAGQIDELGNPTLKPEVTNSYDVGIVHGFSRDIRLDVSAYYKDVKDLVQSVYYKNNLGETYLSYSNRDYADIKGFHVSLEKITGQWQGYLRYNYQIATGKSSNDLNAPVIYFENPDPTYGYVDLPDPEDVFMDYDRSHKMLINLRYNSDRKTGPQIAKFYPLGDVSLSTTFRISSGRPYTFDPTGYGLKYNQRTPNEYEWRLRLQKMLRLKDVNLTLYVEGYNLLNRSVYHYSRTFDDERETPRYYYSGDQVLVYDEYYPYTSSQAIYLLNNEPRHFRFGAIFKF